VTEISWERELARRPCKFRQRDVAAVAKALRAAGYQVAGVQVNGDGFRVIVAGNLPADPEDDLDRELAKFREAHDGKD
jgi:hypothetical protein